MRILQVSHYFAGHVGGIESIAAALGESYARAGHEARWAAFDEPYGRLGRSPACEYVELSGSNLLERLAGLPYPLLSVRSLRRVYEAAREADIVHLHDCAYMACVAAALGARASGVPIVVTQQIGLIPYRNRILRGALALLYRVAGGPTLSAADRVVFVNDDVRRYFESFVSFRKSPVTVPNGVDTKLFRPAGFGERKAARLRHRPADGRRCVLFAGRFTEKKGLQELRSVCEKAEDVAFLFAGWGECDPARWKLPNVRVCYKVSPAELRELYVAADLLILPSKGEGAPLVVYEALSCGLPCLVSEEVARAFTAEGDLLSICDTDSDSILRALAGFFSSVRNRRRVERAIRRYDKSGWDWKARAEWYLDMFEEERGSVQCR